MSSGLLSWAVPRLAQLLPLDDDSLKQIITYSESLSKDASADHLKNLLGESPAALEFIASFNARQANSSRSNDSFGANNTKPKESSSSIAASSMTQVPPPSKPARKAPTTASAGSGNLISDFLPNVKSKTAKQPSRQAASRAASPSKGSVTTNNIADLTSAIAALEMSTNPTIGQERRKCNCYATIHPLFEPAPNCLNCGKIICALEGFQPCSFCGSPLLSSDEVQSIIRELRAERGMEKMRAHNESERHDGYPPPRVEGLPSGDDKLDFAKAHRDRLLSFQAQNARRTRIVDEAADFETPNVASTMWMSPAQRALALKKQQRIQREMDEKARPEWEKKKTFMSLDIKGGKVRKVYHSGADVPEPKEDKEKEQAEKEEEEQEIKATELASEPSNGHAFSRNPLLASGGLFRPVWKAPEGKQKQVDGAAGKETKQSWRRVQDDRDDNEQWILDGGLHGYSD